MKKRRFFQLRLYVRLNVRSKKEMIIRNYAHCCDSLVINGEESAGRAVERILGLEYEDLQVHTELGTLLCPSAVVDRIAYRARLQH